MVMWRHAQNTAFAECGGNNAQCRIGKEPGPGLVRREGRDTRAARAARARSALRARCARADRNTRTHVVFLTKPKNYIRAFVTVMRDRVRLHGRMYFSRGLKVVFYNVYCF